MASPETGGGWFRRFHEAAEDAPSLLCFHHAGGSAGAYHGLSAALRPAAGLIAVQYPGRQDRRHEPVLDDLDKLADLAAAQVAGLVERSGRTPAFFGHSMGAVVAYEVARRLDAPPPILFASGWRAPSCEGERRTHPMSDQELLDDVARLGGTDARLVRSRAFTRMILPVLRGDFMAIGTYAYRPGPPLTCPIVVLAGDDDPMTPVETVQDWHLHTTAGRDDVHVLPGGHFFLDDHRERIAEILLGRLAP
ncbi:thioesterase [Actinomadura darangshiensis]|uniref:Thioesterase n=1 Tax=Actinomadura darangshiensis TaxID=705336 RepID=A0A4R5BTY4_9ACTN|nr:alpha/beta fold hydrolase [Actinomadura darangshiensis]TDD87662.1 thioesterase [Actinomadura darangshiensis]